MKITYIPPELAFVIIPGTCPALIESVEAAYDRGEIDPAVCSDWVRFLRAVERRAEEPS